MDVNAIFSTGSYADFTVEDLRQLDHLLRQQHLELVAPLQCLHAQRRLQLIQGVTDFEQLDIQIAAGVLEVERNGLRMAEIRQVPRPSSRHPNRQWWELTGQDF